MAAPVDAGSIFSDVRIRLDKLNGDIKAVNTGFDKLGKNLRENSDKTTKTQTDNFKKVGLAGVAAIGAITLAFKKSIAVFAETEQSLANVEAVSNATAAEFRELKNAAEDAGTTTRFTAGQAADALFFLSSAGLSATQSVKALDGVLQLAGATGSDLAQTAQAVTSTLSQFGLAAEKSADIANIFAAANSNSQATLDKLQNSLRQVGPVAAGLDIELEEVVGSLQALFNAGFQGESAGRALKSALADLANEASPTIEKLEALGVSFASVNPEAVGLTGAIGALEDAGLSTAQVIEAFGKVAGPQLLTLINTGKDAIEDYTAAVTGTNEAARQYEVQNNTLAGSIDSLKSAVEGTSNSFIEQLAPILRIIIDSFAAVLRILNKVDPVLKGAGIGAAVAAGGFLALSRALAAVGVTLAGSAGVVAGIGAVVVAFSSLLIKAREIRQIQLADTFSDLARDLGRAGQAIDEFVGIAGKVEQSILQFGKFENSIDKVAARVALLSERLGISEEEVIKIGLASEEVSDRYKEQLTLLQDQFVAQELINQKEKERSSTLTSQLAIEAEIARALAAQALEKSRVAAEEKSRVDRLEEIGQKLITLDELAAKGAISEQVALEDKKALREEEIGLLLEQALVSGEVTDQVLKNIAIQQAAVDRYSERLETLKEQQENDSEENKTREQIEADERLRIRLLTEDAIREREIRAKDEKTLLQEEATEKELEELEKRKEANLAFYNNVTGLASGFFGALVDLSAATTNARIADINKVLAASELAIDNETQALLKSLGIQEDTKLESLEKRLEEAIAEGELETAAELRQEIQRTQILDDAEARKQELRLEADAEVKKLNREQAVREKALAIFNAGINTASAIIGFLANPGGFVGIGFSVAAGITGGTQIAAIASQPLPSLQTGGIVLPKAGGTTAILAENGSPELALNAGSEGAGLLDLFAQRVAAAGAAGGGGGRFTLILNRDGRKEAESVVDYINNGIVELEI